jgi:glutathione S-transferase
MELYYYEVSNPRKACAVAKHLHLPVEFVHVDLGANEQHRPEYLAINPNAKVPTLVDGNNTVWESSAIMMYLAQQANSDLWPTDRVAQVQVVQWLSWDAAHFSRHAGTLFFEHVVKQRFGIGAPDPAEVDSALESVRRFGAVLDRHLEGRSFVVNDRLSIADFSLAGQISLPGEATMAHYVPQGEFRQIERWVEALARIPAWKSPWPTD